MKLKLLIFLIFASFNFAADLSDIKFKPLWTVSRGPDGDIISLDSDKTIKFSVPPPQKVSRIDWCNSTNGERAIFVINQQIKNGSDDRKNFYKFKELLLIQQTNNTEKTFKPMSLNTGTWEIQEVAAINNKPILKVLLKAVVRDSINNKLLYRWFYFSWVDGYRALPQVVELQLD